MHLSSELNASKMEITQLKMENADLQRLLLEERTKAGSGSSKRRKVKS